MNNCINNTMLNIHENDILCNSKNIIENNYICDNENNDEDIIEENEICAKIHEEKMNMVYATGKLYHDLNNERIKKIEKINKLRGQIKKDSRTKNKIIKLSKEINKLDEKLDFNKILSFAVKQLHIIDKKYEK